MPSKVAIMVSGIGLTSVASTSAFNQQDTIATYYGGDASEHTIANPSGLSKVNSTDSAKSIPTVNITAFHGNGGGGGWGSFTGPLE